MTLAMNALEQALKQDQATPLVDGRSAADQETFEFLRDHLRRLRRSMRRARPTPREGIEASIDLMDAAITERLNA